MTPLMTSNVLSTGPLEGGGAEDDGGGLNAGVAPGNDMTQNTGAFMTVSIFTSLYLLILYSLLCFTVLLHLFNQILRSLVQEKVWQQWVTWRAVTEHDEHHTSLG